MAVILQNDQICRYIHTPSSFARQNLLYIQETGRLKSRDRHISRRSHLESYLFFIVLSGRGTVTIGKNLWEIGPGDHIFLDCQEPYAHESSEDDPWTLLWVHFYGTAMSGSHAYFTRHQKASVFHPDSPSDFQSILEQILILEKNRAGNRELLENELLHRLVTQILTWQTEIPVKKEDNITSKLLEIRGFLDEHLLKKYPLMNWQTCSISANTICRGNSKKPSESPLEVMSIPNGSRKPKNYYVSVISRLKRSPEPAESMTTAISIKYFKKQKESQQENIAENGGDNDVKRIL